MQLLAHGQSSPRYESAPCGLAAVAVRAERCGATTQRAEKYNSEKTRGESEVRAEKYNSEKTRGESEVFKGRYVGYQ